jgi:ABC-type multidrug transport system fused ATPase/permease subunit
MSDLEVQPAVESAPEAVGLSQWQRVTNTFTAPSKTFEDIKSGNKSWWLPFILTILSFLVFYGSVSAKVTWATVAENEQRNMPEFFKRMTDRMPPEQRAEQERKAPMSQAISAAFAPFGILLMDVIAAGVLLATINFGFGGKAKFGSLFAVTLYAGLVLWPIRWILSAITLFAGLDPEMFNIHYPAPTNVGAFFNYHETPLPLYAFLASLDAPTIWCMVVTSIGVATVAGVKRTSGYIAVFGWWVIGLLLGVGIAAAFS